MADHTNQPVVITSTPTIYLDAINRNLSLHCIPIDKRFHYKWEIRSGNISSRAQGTNSSELFIPSPVPEDSGEYRCIISNSTGTIASDYKRIVIQGVIEIFYVMHILQICYML